MIFEYSKELIDKTINWLKVIVLKEEDGIEMTIDQAHEALHSLSGLYLAFSIANDKKGKVE